MRFLLFNVVVAGALVYLFGAEPVKQAATEGVSVAVDLADKAVEALRQGDFAAVSENLTPPREPTEKERTLELQKRSAKAQAAPVITPGIKTTGAPLAPVAEVRETKPTPLPPIVEAVWVRTVPVHKAPAEKKVASSTPKVEVPQFMTPKQRWRELNQLAHEMEIMFADKMVR